MRCVKWPCRPIQRLWLKLTHKMFIVTASALQCDGYTESSRCEHYLNSVLPGGVYGPLFCKLKIFKELEFAWNLRLERFIHYWTISFSTVLFSVLIQWLVEQTCLRSRRVILYFFVHSYTWWKFNGSWKPTG